MAPQYPRMHIARYYGAYANRRRRLYREEDGGVTVRPVAEADRPSGSRASWARLLRKVFEVDPLTCARCGAEMKVIAVITAPAIVDRMLSHLEKNADADDFDARAPPAA